MISPVMSEGYAPDDDERVRRQGGTKVSHLRFNISSLSLAPFLSLFLLRGHPLLARNLEYIRRTHVLHAEFARARFKSATRSSRN